MLSPADETRYADRVRQILAEAGVALSPGEKVELAELGLGEFEVSGLSIVTYVNNDRYCGKELVLLAGQTCPEHRHPPVGNDPGKRETFRCRKGTVYLYVEGPPAAKLRAAVPKGSEPYYTVFNEVILTAGTQYTIEPGIKHWFQAGRDGPAVVTEFSSASRDELDIFTDPRIVRVPPAA